MTVSPTSPTSASKTPSPSERGTTRTPAPAPRIDARYPGEGRCPQPQTRLKAEDMESVLLDACAGGSDASQFVWIGTIARPAADARAPFGARYDRPPGRLRNERTRPNAGRRPE